MAVTEVKTYVCSDGAKFPDKWTADKHEQELDDAAFAKMHGNVSTKAAKWLRTSYSGIRLREKHALTEKGTWRIRGEDSNCDMGGAHYRPELGTVEGMLLDVVEHAMNLEGFYTWGGGGDITEVLIKKV
jgi:hypothetical protein